MPAVKQRKNQKVPKPIIRKDDIIEVRAGKDKGKRGRVIRVFPAEGRVLVEKVSLAKRHTRPDRKQRGGIVEKEAKISLSNVMPVCPKTSQPSRVGWRVLEDGRKVRYLKKSGEMLDEA
ncbi:MAG: 50S ribosomal protein L24 [Nitrospinota bacterium]